MIYINLKKVKCSGEHKSIHWHWCQWWHARLSTGHISYNKVVSRASLQLTCNILSLKEKKMKEKKQFSPKFEYVFFHLCDDIFDPAHQKRELYRWSQFWVFCLMYSKSFFSALKWHLIYENWSRHSNFTIEKVLKILLVILILFSKCFHLSKKSHSCKVPLFMRCITYRLCNDNVANMSHLKIIIPRNKMSFYHNWPMKICPYSAHTSPL